MLPPGLMPNLTGPLGLTAATMDLVLSFVFMGFVLEEGIQAATGAMHTAQDLGLRDVERKMRASIRRRAAVVRALGREMASVGLKFGAGWIAYADSVSRLEGRDPSTYAHPPVERARVFRAVDGDTLALEDGRRVRIYGINAPEKGAPGYQEAKQFLDLVARGQEAVLTQWGDDLDIYGRLVRGVVINGIDVGALLVWLELAKPYTYLGREAKERQEAGPVGGG